MFGSDREHKVTPCKLGVLQVIKKRKEKGKKINPGTDKAIRLTAALLY